MNVFTYELFLNLVLHCFFYIFTVLYVRCLDIVHSCCLNFIITLIFSIILSSFTICADIQFLFIKNKIVQSLSFILQKKERDEKKSSRLLNDAYGCHEQQILLFPKCYFTMNFRQCGAFFNFFICYL